MIAEALERLCERGPWRLGQVLASRAPEGTFTLQHEADARLGHEGDVAPRHLLSPEEVRDWVRYDWAGRYRPLKGAPTLRRGWFFETPSVRDLHRALDFIYPGAIGSWLAWRSSNLPVVHLRQTLGRQSGLYRVTRKLTDDEADRMIGRFCQSETGCLRTILWRIDEARPVSSLPGNKFDPHADQLGRPGACVPVLCAEPCNLLVAEARAVVKKQREA